MSEPGHARYWSTARSPSTERGPCCGYRALADASFEYGPLPAELTAAIL